ncbi:MAG: chemotaxis protein CheW [Candidatus Thiodiazotropha sp. (ex Lucinoma kastoroae)]|nr:chemotaxis protein CheW [Candidatus Thiodiazotropha sp. (ex Rostrolucina anterorostrata)]MCU7847883.1 chemotaxis protein CheW [Candidatus Thiodiazotropha sp. (ex Lucinoma kastoroae)]MCU7859659.1 chemotaxis protein CheW [Candidatus Thiodiazotropha sp. (ex Lucinoma kastoroae)]
MKQVDKLQALREVASKIAEPDSALKSYLDTLLLEIDGPLTTVPKVEVKEPPTDADIKVEEIEQSAVAVHQPAIHDEQLSQQKSAPSWAESAFQVLLFKVNGIKLGIPLSSLMGILSYPGEASQLPGQPGWSLGVVVNRDEKVIIINSTRLLMPERLTGNEALHPQHLLLIGDGHRALAVDSICDTLTVEKDEVRWRSGSGLRPWYAGIIIQELSVLLDVDGVLEMLAA